MHACVLTPPPPCCYAQLHHLQLQGASCDSPPASMGLPPSNLPRLAASYVDFSFWMLQGAIDFAVRIDCRDMGAPPRAEVLPLPRELAVRPDGTGKRQLPARIACSQPACLPARAVTAAVPTSCCWAAQGLALVHWEQQSVAPALLAPCRLNE
jgi:hypothetical protein